MIVTTDDKHYHDIAAALRRAAPIFRELKPEEMAEMIDGAANFRENMGKEAGYSDGFSAGVDHGHAQGYSEGYATGLESGMTMGQQAEYDRFWDECQISGKRLTYTYAFAGIGWAAETFKPKYSMQPTLASYMFAAFGSGNDNSLNLVEALAQQNVTLDFSQCTNMSYCFYQAHIARIGTIDLTSAADVTSVFNSVYLITIEKLIPPNKAMAHTCWQTGLINLTIGGTITEDFNLSRCSKLTNASVQSIADHLADLTGKTTKTLTVHQTVRNAMTAEQVNEIVNVKNWTLAPAATTN